MFMTTVDGGVYGWPRSFPVGAAEQRWLDDSCILALAYSKEVQGVDAEAQLLDLTIVGRAAEHLWANSDEAPQWRDLDVDAIIHSLGPLLHGGDGHDLVATVLDSFAVWLHANRHIGLQDVIAIRSRLCPHVAPLYRRLLAECVGPSVLN